MEKSLYIWIEYINIYVLLNFGEDPSSIKVMPIAHVPHPQGAPSLSAVLTNILLCPCVPLSMCQKRCQVVKKDVKCQKVKHMDYGGPLYEMSKLTSICVNLII